MKAVIKRPDGFGIRRVVAGGKHYTIDRRWGTSRKIAPHYILRGADDQLVSAGSYADIVQVVKELHERPRAPQELWVVMKVTPGRRIPALPPQPKDEALRDAVSYTDANRGADFHYEAEPFHKEPQS